MKLDDIIQQPGQKELIQQASILGRINVSRPGKVVRYDETTKCVDVQPTVRDLNSKGLPPLLTNVPVIFFGGFTYNINVGDECIVIFADTSTEGWWQTGDVANPVTGRRHDLSDGFALVGVRSLPNAGKGINLNDKIDELSETAFRLYIDENGCLMFYKAEGVAYIDENGCMIYEKAVDNIDFYLDSDGCLWMEVE